MHLNQFYISEESEHIAFRTLNLEALPNRTIALSSYWFRRFCWRTSYSNRSSTAEKFRSWDRKASKALIIAYRWREKNLDSAFSRRLSQRVLARHYGEKSLSHWRALAEQLVKSSTKLIVGVR